MSPIWGFIAVTVPLVLSPGPSIAVVLRNSLTGGVRAGLLTSAGANGGSVCYGLLTAFGFAATLQRWPSAWLALRWTGVAYLSWLGIESFRRAAHAHRAISADRGDPPPAAWQSLSSGFLTNVLNPSLMAFYLIVLPQFIPREALFARSTLTLTAIHVTMASSWHTAWVLAGATLARVLSRQRPRQLLDVVTGIAMLALAVKVFRSVGP